MLLQCNLHPLLKSERKEREWRKGEKNKEDAEGERKRESNDTNCGIKKSKVNQDDMDYKVKERKKNRKRN